MQLAERLEHPISGRSVPLAGLDVDQGLPHQPRVQIGDVLGSDPGAVVTGFLQPYQQQQMLQQLCDKKITSFAMEFVESTRSPSLV